MKKFSFSLLLTVLMLTLAVSGTALGASTGAISASDYKAGDTVTIEGSIDPGQDLYITIAQKTLFAPKDTTGSHEVKRLAKGRQEGQLQRGYGHSAAVLRHHDKSRRLLAKRVRKGSAAPPCCWARATASIRPPCFT
jgi:hypothetical protein